VIEGLIPVLDVLEQHSPRIASGIRQLPKGIRAHLQAALEKRDQARAERIDPLANHLIPTCIRRWIALKHRTTKTAPFWQVFSRDMCSRRVLRPAMVRLAVHPNPASKEAVN